MIKRIGFLFGTLVICLLLVAVMLHASAAQEAPQMEMLGTTVPTRPATTTPPTQSTTKQTTQTPQPVTPPALEAVALSADQVQYGTLILSDRAYQNENAVFVPLEVPSAQEYTMQKEAAQALAAMLKDYQGYPISVRYARAETKDSWYSPECYDGVYASGLDVCFQGDANGKAVNFTKIGSGKDWLYNNCQAYGFVPCAANDSVTEAGHFRYVGIPHAQVMQRLKLSLSSYLSVLRNAHFSYDCACVVDVGRIRYHVFYVTADKDGNYTA
jgi:LAS superfamily LD-carboxypeptidase LdcB